ncbi:MAG: 30S ribosomal protein S8 [Candidatus Harrisonbacteria bacterium CG10_big_fil_rev_8_21_14_0_10_40_38]|uniref:Small ribosomal subunit protein uS8 n=1 Tax=Candidatus Harrisonbacteria bacterium CG10_big_fil_rev_8_21_14_0_10_40_38 TaxID=1974583 RepID=A0A2H0UUA7_9BACT|nr:MAG: 30S ribosomal protein S8 [Candidatus Harrisonbacteria bacterium CG10_big_fil_rev_8_21_14_0_10_40_38]
MYTDLLTKIKNAQGARKETMKVPYSNMDLKIAELLQKYGYIESVAKKGRLPKRVLEIKLKYEGKKGVITGIKFLSKPSRRIYSGYEDLRPTKLGGHSTSVISTPKGIMSFRQARREKVGGELLFEIW